MKDHREDCKCSKKVFEKVDNMVKNLDSKGLSECLLLTSIALSVHAHEWHFEREKKIVKEAKGCLEGTLHTSLIDSYMYSKCLQQLLKLAGEEANGKKDQ